MNLVKSRQRVAAHGEVFTPAWMVEAMLDLVKGKAKDGFGNLASKVSPSQPFSIRTNFRGAGGFATVRRSRCLMALLAALMPAGLGASSVAAEGDVKAESSRTLPPSPAAAPSPDFSYMESIEVTVTQIGGRGLGGGSRLQISIVSGDGRFKLPFGEEPIGRIYGTQPGGSTFKLLAKTLQHEIEAFKQREMVRLRMEKFKFKLPPIPGIPPETAKWLQERQQEEADRYYLKAEVVDPSWNPPNGAPLPRIRVPIWKTLPDENIKETRGLPISKVLEHESLKKRAVLNHYASGIPDLTEKGASRPYFTINAYFTVPPPPK